jgi:hypothetical protein
MYGTDIALLMITTTLRKRAVTMREKRSEASDRRHINNIPRTPFKDSNGATIKKCRRKILDRRTNDVAGLVNR